MKKIVSALLAAVLAVSVLAGCGSGNDNQAAGSGANTGTEGGSAANAENASDLKIGVIMIGDETETYTKAHIDGIKEAAASLGISEGNIQWKERVEESEDCYDAAKTLVADGCQLVISNSYGHQDFMVEAAEEFTDVNFVAMTGDFAAISGLDNFYNAFTNVYESRYVSGVVAGMKVAELNAAGEIPAEGYDENGNVKIGYVGAYPYAEVVSGYTAFFLGIQSVFPDVVMDVQYTNSWFDIEGEAAAADVLIKRGCVIIGQHADSTGAPDTVEKAWQNGQVVYSVGYNMSMLDVAPDAALTSATNVWTAYYKELFSAVLNGTEIPQDWAKGYADNAVAITALGPNVAEGTAEKVAEIEAALKDSSLYVFDTSKFTVGGAAVTEDAAMIDLSYMDWSTMTAVYEGETVSALKTDANNVTYFDESVLRAAPYFSLRIDGITELNGN